MKPGELIRLVFFAGGKNTTKFGRSVNSRFARTSGGDSDLKLIGGGKRKGAGLLVSKKSAYTTGKQYEYW